MNTTITFKEHAKATLLVLALIAVAITIGILFCSCTSKSGMISKTNSEQMAQWNVLYEYDVINKDTIPVDTIATPWNVEYTYPDSIMLRINDFKYYWVDDIRNKEFNYEFIVETGFNNGVDYEHVTQAMFNKRYDIHTIEYWIKHNYKQHK